MRKIVAELFSSLDGVVESPDKWHFPYHTDEMSEQLEAQLAASDTMLLGRRTYLEHAGYWPTATGTMADLMNTIPKVVLSTTLTDPKWQNTTIVADDFVEVITRLRQQPGGTILSTGSTAIVRRLLDNGLLDELHLLIDPVIVGTGTRLFEDVSRTGLKLLSTQTFGSGTVSVRYGIEGE